MFCCPLRRWKKNRCAVVDIGETISSSPQTRVAKEEEPIQDPVVPFKAESCATIVSVPAETLKAPAKKTPWWHKCCLRKKKTKQETPVEEDVAVTSVQTIKGGEAGVQEASSTPDTQVSTPSETGQKKRWWRRCPFSLCKRRKPKSPESTETTSEMISDPLPTVPSPAGPPSPTTPGLSLLMDLLSNGVLDRLSSPEEDDLSTNELVCLGFPNLAQTCYMNSTLQGLLTLTPFVQEVHNQQQVWSSYPEPPLIRRFAEVGASRLLNNKAEKKGVLAAFKSAVAEFNTEFADAMQKDAHEFLSCVLDTLRSQSMHLQVAACEMGISYSCPVDTHIAFQMLSIRTCQGCGMQSMREEDFMNLSLDLSGPSIGQCLQEYLNTNQLEYRCECGAQESSQQWSFLTLPNVLILQLQRFKFSESFDLEKVDSPIEISRELLVTPESTVGMQETTRYSLVSVVSHLGSTAHSGHYICDGAHREQGPSDETDRWLTYNDRIVSEMSGESVCHERQRSAYLLFYERHQ